MIDQYHKSKYIYGKIFFISISFLFFIAFLNCKNNNRDELLSLFSLLSIQENIPENNSIKIDETQLKHTVTFEVKIDDVNGSYKFEQIKAILTFPSNKILNNNEAVVVLHGSGGLWKNKNPNQGLSNQYANWNDLLQQRGYIVLFIDSYNSRGISENIGDIRTPPGNKPISAEYVRNRDSLAGLEYLTRLKGTNDQVLVNPKKVAVLGFSHGGTSVISSITNLKSDIVKEKLSWNQTYQGNFYDAPSPLSIKYSDHFKLGISYYPGVGMYNYFGYLGTYYENNCPMLLIGAENDELYFNGENLYQKFIDNVSKNNRSLNIKKIIYSGANHSFDNKSEGIDGDASNMARIEVLNYLEENL